jgi:hypothetical protein
MTITLQLWMLFPALCVLGAVGLFAVSAQDSGFMGGCVEAAVGLMLLLVAAAFLIGRWAS